MFFKNWKTEVFTVPNLLSLLRLLLLPFYTGIYLRATEPRQYLLAGAVMAVSCLTDLLDGMIARRFHQVTRLGQVLDPLADKVTQLTLILCLSLKYSALGPVLALFLVKEALQLLTGIWFLRKGQMLEGALAEGKVCTAVLFLTLLVPVLFPNVPEAIVEAIAVSDGFLLVVSFFGYTRAYFGKETKTQDL